MSGIVLAWALLAAAGPDGGAQAEPKIPGIDLIEQGKTAEAVEALEQALQDAPDDPALRLALGRACLRLGNHQQALNAYSAILMKDRRHLEANLGRARALLGLGDAPKAVAPARTATELAPDRVDTWLLLGDVYAHDSLQDHPRAVEAYRRARALAPRRLDVAMRLARSLSYTKEVEQAIEVLEQARARHPGAVPLLVKLAESYYAVRDLDRAETLIREAVEAAPDDPEARRVLEQIEGRRAYNFWVPVIAVVAFPVLFFLVRWLKRGRTPRA